MTSRKLLAVSLAVLLLGPTLIAGTDVGGKKLPDSITIGEHKLVFNGAGLRKKLFIKVYAGALYLNAKSKNRAAVLAADEAMAVRMHFIYNGVGPDKLTEAWNEGFDAALGANKASQQKHIDAFNKLFTAEAKTDDIYEIAYLPGKGVQVIVNGKVIGTVNGGLEFKKAVFGIWLGEKSALKDLGDAMLGS